ncbi:MAG TPA: hypothetical protein VL443_07540 [Cyclobacteriaceae bacterium]|jgi:hypothetical protein|nr:hypothetical protein [Cyclobacteriaceae bacterium]
MLKKIFLTAITLTLAYTTKAQPEISLQDTHQNIRRYPLNQPHKLTSGFEMNAASYYINEF